MHMIMTLYALKHYFSTVLARYELAMHSWRGLTVDSVHPRMRAARSAEHMHAGRERLHRMHVINLR